MGVQRLEDVVRVAETPDKHGTVRLCNGALRASTQAEQKQVLERASKAHARRLRRGSRQAASLNLANNDLVALPRGVWKGLDGLQGLILTGNRLSPGAIPWHELKAALTPGLQLLYLAGGNLALGALARNVQTAADVATLLEEGAAKFDAPPFSTAQAFRMYKAVQKATVVKNMDNLYPEVLISYAAGCRENVDGHAVGPGIGYAHDLAMALHTVGIQSFSGLNADGSWKVYYPKINGPHTRAKVFIVLLTRALFDSLECLEQITRAVDIPNVIAVLYDEPDGFPSDRWGRWSWPVLDAGGVRRMAVAQGVLGGGMHTTSQLAVFPRDGVMGGNLRRNTAELVRDVQGKLSASATSRRTTSRRPSMDAASAAPPEGCPEEGEESWRTLAMEASTKPVTLGGAHALQRRVQRTIPVSAHHAHLNLDQFYPQVVITYATGTRKGYDAAGTGPGMLYAHDVVMALHRAAIHCFSGLHAPAGVNWSIYFNKFKGRLPKCKVFIVIQTKQLYASVNCLHECAAAVQGKHRGVVKHIIPTVFEHGVPRGDAQWPLVDRADTDSGACQLGVVQEGLGSLTAHPPRGVMTSTQDEYRRNLVELVEQVKVALED